MNQGFISSTISSFFLIFLSEITDKTFIIIILMTSKIPPLLLYITSISATLIMNYLSIGLGFILPYIINEKVMNCIAFSLFIMFGIISIIEGRSIEKKNGLTNLFEETEKELNIEEEDEDYYLMIEDDNEIENIKTEATSPNISRRKDKNNINYNNNNKTYGLCLALFFTFMLSDIGDKSQIATITIAAIYNLYGVILGTTFAFLLTCALGILCGNFICEKISTKNIMFIGGTIFFIFAGELLYKIIG